MSLTAAQVEARMHGLGGSDAPTLVPYVDPYRQPLQLYMEKRGEWPAPDLSDNDAVRFGNLLEDIVAKEWSRRAGRAVRRESRTFRHSEHDHMLGHIDRRVTGRLEGLECKNRGFRAARDYGASGSGEVAERDFWQCQHYLHVTGWDRWHLACYFGGADFRMYTVEPDPALAEILVELEADFWRRVRECDPPPLEPAHGTTPGLIKRLYPGTDGRAVELDREAVQWHLALQDATERRKEAAKDEQLARMHLLEAMGTAALATLPGFEGAYRRQLTQRSGYEVEPKEFIDFRFLKRAPK